MAKEVEHFFMWEGIGINILFKPDYFPSVGVSHLEVRAETPLPFTESGYRSIWVMPHELEDISVLEYVKKALVADSNSKKWKDYLKQKKIDDLAKTQFSLF